MTEVSEVEVTAPHDPEVARLWTELATEQPAGSSKAANGSNPAPAAVPAAVAARPASGIKILGSTAKDAPAPAAGGIKMLYKAPVQVVAVDVRKVAAESLAAMLSSYGITSPAGRHVISIMNEKIAGMEANKNAVEKEAALLLVKAVVDIVGASMEPYLIPLIPLMFDRMPDKSAPVRVAAGDALTLFAAKLNPGSVPIILPAVMDCCTNSTKKWQQKEVAFKMISSFATVAPTQMRKFLPELVPIVSDGMVDARDEVKTAGYAAAALLFGLVGNRDIQPCVDDFLACISRPAEMAAAVVKLSGTTFVQQVEGPALAVMVPLLTRGLKGETSVKRKTASIIANMSKLVNNPADVAAFLPKLLPRLEQAAKEVSDPECRSVCEAAEATLKRMVEDGEAQEQDETITKYEITNALAALNYVLLAATPPPNMEDPLLPLVLNHIAGVAVTLVAAKDWDEAIWSDQCVVPFLTPYMDSENAVFDIAKALMNKCLSETREELSDEEEFEEGEDVCNCYFSLAYGGKILLNNTHMRLKRGHRYGLCGANGVGKSTLMKAINSGKVEGFPPKSEVCTAYVEHDIDSSASDLTSVDFMAQDPTLQESRPTGREAIEEMLTSLGFSVELLAQNVAALSGGWKMKLALARAVLMKPDIMLLDEPTNHLDTTNVAWLENYLQNLINVTVLVVSHDSGFLDKVCTDIIHYETRKLKRYKGNLSEFVKVKPEARSYYELASASLRFNFPRPGILDGVTSSEKPILKLTKVNFTYPGSSKPQLLDISVNCRLASRVAVRGVNGAGKSTLIKILTGEIRSEVGLFYKHPNCRVAYVAQHAFHHIEEHLDATPNQYLRRRYLTGEDKEEALKVSRVISKEEEEKIKKQIWEIDGQSRVLDKLLGRRKKKRSWEYEVKWVGLDSIKFNRWIPRETLEERGFIKMVNEYDGKLAATAAGADTRPLTQASIEEYLSDFGLDPEFGTHSMIRGLSGGQKVKLVLAAAMWNNPHLLIMDEPTNYLDRDSLGALAAAIKDFSGGVVLISHHAEFLSTITEEIWHVEAGRLTVELLKGNGGEEEVEEEKVVKPKYGRSAAAAVKVYGAKPI